MFECSHSKKLFGAVALKRFQALPAFEFRVHSQNDACPATKVVAQISASFRVSSIRSSIEFPHYPDLCAMTSLLFILSMYVDKIKRK